MATVMVTLLTACATLGRAPPGDGPGDLLAFYHYAATLEPESRRATYLRFRNWVREDRCEPDRIRLAMLVMQAESGPAGEMKGGQVLKPCLNNGDEAHTYLGHLALLLDRQIRLQNRVDRLVSKWGQLVERREELEAERDELTRDLIRATRRYRTVEDERDKLRKRVDSLEKQLDALKNIERSIRQRN
ncbi:hypothetical protein [Thiohalorhabdus sp.]|uniref:hypothetical protein n=1 Tax=Thiohalorhabdus sp. TaxID=3094134 RepID=UPI002FC2C56F